MHNEKLSHTPTGTLIELERQYSSRTDFEGTSIHKGIVSEISDRSGGFSVKIAELESRLNAARAEYSKNRTAQKDFTAKEINLKNEISLLKEKVKHLESEAKGKR